MLPSDAATGGWGGGLMEGHFNKRSLKKLHSIICNTVVFFRSPKPLETKTVNP